MKEDTQRNLALTKDKLGGMSWTKISRKYNLSNTRAQRIVERTKVKYAEKLKVT